MEEILALAAKVAEEAEVFSVTSEEIPVQFQANHLKNIQSKQSSSVSLRIIKNGKLGYAGASGEIDKKKLVDIAVETSQFGMPARFSFPQKAAFPAVAVADADVDLVPIADMIDLGQSMIDPVLKSTPGIQCEAGVSRSRIKVKLMNSRGGHAQYEKTVFGMGVGGTLVRDTDMLFVGESQESCRVIQEAESLVRTVLRQLELAKDQAQIKTAEMPVIFTPDGLVSAFIPALMSAFNGKTVLLGASPLANKLGQTVFDTGLTMYDDPLVDYAPNSRPCDDEGVPSRMLPLIEQGAVKNFIYDLQTAGQAKAASTGGGGRGRAGQMAPSASALVIKTGEAAFEEMVQDIKEGLIVEQLMGAEQGNVLGGDFSGNVLLGYKIENGKIVGRVKNTMVSGNVYQALNNIAVLGKEAKWVGGSVFAPHIYCRSLSVASK